MKKSIIEQKTVLLPHVIAGIAIWEVLEKDYLDLTPEQCGKLEEKYSPFLCEKSDTLYRNNLQFKRGITSNERGRDLLASYMGHWFKGEYERDKKKIINHK